MFDDPQVGCIKTSLVFMCPGAMKEIHYQLFLENAYLSIYLFIYLFIYLSIIFLISQCC